MVLKGSTMTLVLRGPTISFPPSPNPHGLRNVVWWSVVVGGSDVFSAFRLFGIASPSNPTKNSIPARLLGAASFSGRLARP
jgi:hypothetical protein